MVGLSRLSPKVIKRYPRNVAKITTKPIPSQALIETDDQSIVLHWLYPTGIVVNIPKKKVHFITVMG